MQVLMKDNRIPKYNGKKCKEGCNCVEIAGAKNGGDNVKNYQCLDSKNVFDELTACNKK